MTIDPEQHLPNLQNLCICPVVQSLPKLPGNSLQYVLVFGAEIQWIKEVLCRSTPSTKLKCTKMLCILCFVFPFAAAQWCMSIQRLGTVGLPNEFLIRRRNFLSEFSTQPSAVSFHCQIQMQKIFLKIQNLVYLSSYKEFSTWKFGPKQERNLACACKHWSQVRPCLRLGFFQFPDFSILSPGCTWQRKRLGA